MIDAPYLVFMICPECGGDGGFTDTYIGRDHNVRSDDYPCNACDCEGFIWREDEPAGEEWILDTQEEMERLAA